MDINLLIEQNRTLFIILLIWTLIWKGIALWKTAKKNKKGWFISILVLNTLGILPIIYIFIVDKYFILGKTKNE
jgi:hypothetical protein